MQLASTSRTTEVVRSADRKAPVTPPREPSWGRVLATTISLWTARRIPRLRRPGQAMLQRSIPSANLRCARDRFAHVLERIGDCARQRQPEREARRYRRR